MPKTKANPFSQFVSTARRSAGFSSARQFHEAARLSCTYPHYYRVENGSIPKADLAVEILRALNTDLKAGLAAWMAGQMPDGETRGMFVSISQPPSGRSNHPPLA